LKHLPNIYAVILEAKFEAFSVSVYLITIFATNQTSLFANKLILRSTLQDIEKRWCWVWYEQWWVQEFGGTRQMFFGDFQRRRHSNYLKITQNI